MTLTSILAAVDVTYHANGGQWHVIDGGASHTVVLRGDGSVMAWGYNASGQTTIPNGLTGVIAVTAGNSHTMALRGDGTVVAWGDNGYGQLNVPAGLSGVVAVATGTHHSVALRGDGTVVAWGDNLFGQSAAPNGLTGVIAVAAGDYHTVGLRGDGSVVAWGYNGSGQTAVPNDLTNVVAVAAGDYHTMALRGDGSVMAWGYNGNGQTTIPDGLSDVVAVAAGTYHSVALRSGGTVVAWGDNSYGQTTVPAGLTGVIAVAAGARHTVALCGDGTVVVWGDNGYGQTIVPSALNLLSQGKVPGVDLLLSHGECTHIGYTLQSWNTSADGSGTAYALGGTFTTDVATTLYAQWAPLPIISYDVHGGSGSIPSWSVSTGLIIPLSTGKEFQRPGYVIVGWNTAADGSGTSYNLGAPYTVGTTAVLYAQWHPTLTYHANGGQWHVIDGGFNDMVALRADGSVVAYVSGNQTTVPDGLTDLIAVESDLPPVWWTTR